MLSLSRLVEKYGQYKQVPSRPDEFRFCCPYCIEAGKPPDTKYHLYINIKKATGYCFRCGKKLKFDGNLNYKVKREFEVIQSKESKAILKEIPKSMPITPDTPAYEFLKYKFEGILSEEELQEKINKFGLEYCIDTNYLHLIDRIIIPITFYSEVVACQFRSIYGQEPKYLSYSVNGRNIKEYLFNFDNACKYSEVWLMEGVFDVIPTLENAVALFGKDITDIQAKIIAENFSCVTIALDADAYDSAKKIAKKLSEIGNFDKIMICKLPEGKDPGDSGKRILECELEEFDLDSEFNFNNWL